MQPLLVADLMTLSPVTVPKHASLHRVVTYMEEEGIRQLPVVDSMGRLVGIITDRDVLLVTGSPRTWREAGLHDRLLDNLSAAGCMTPDPITVTPETPAYRAAEMLSCYKFGALPVMDNGELVGIIRITDILDEFAAQQREAIRLDRATARV